MSHKPLFGSACRSQGLQASGRECRLRFHKRHGFLKKNMSNRPLFGSASHLANKGSWKAGRPTSNPLLPKAESRQFFIASWLVLHGNMGPASKDATTNCLGDLQTKKIYAQLDCDRHELLGSSKDSKCWVQNIYGEKSFESVTDSQPTNPSWQCSRWIVTPDSINSPLPTLWLNS